MKRLSAKNKAVAALIKAATKVAAHDLTIISERGPRERLPKEDQIRCSMYAALKPLCDLIQVEAAYFDADRNGGKSECDFRVWLKDGSECWIEIKRAWEGQGYVNKVPELRRSWKSDISKLRRAKSADHRVFVLFTFSDKDPCSDQTPLCRAIHKFHPRHRICGEKKSVSFSWRKKFNFMGAWIWVLPQKRGAR
jgi:hypothetical protein